MTDTHKALLAIAEAERVASAFERPFSKLLGKTGFTPDLVDGFAKEFMVARSFRWQSKEELRLCTSQSEKDAAKKRGKQRVKHGFSKFLASLPKDYSGTLSDHFTALCDRVSTHPTAKVIWDNGEFPSALSKFQMAQSNWNFPPCDRHAADTARIKKSLNSKDRAIAYYRALDKAKFHETKHHIATVLSDRKIDLHPSRIIDKHMIIKAFETRPMLEAFIECQTQQTQNTWNTAAEEIAPTLVRFDSMLKEYATPQK